MGFFSKKKIEKIKQEERIRQAEEELKVRQNLIIKIQRNAMMSRFINDFISVAVMNKDNPSVKMVEDIEDINEEILTLLGKMFIDKVIVEPRLVPEENRVYYAFKIEKDDDLLYEYGIEGNTNARQK